MGVYIWIMSALVPLSFDIGLDIEIGTQDQSLTI